MARVKITDSDYGPIVRLKDLPAGTQFEGRFRRLRDGKNFGDRMSILADLATADGDVSLPANAVLERKLGRVRVGALVMVTFLGPKDSKNGNVFNDWDVEAEPEDILPKKSKPAEHTRRAVERVQGKPVDDIAVDDDIPF
jgi:hypothetical protein